MTPHFLAPASPSGLPQVPRPSFSVLIPAYNASATIGEAVASALEQTLPAHEVIVVDDGSTDDLDEALAPYRERILLLYKENGGGATALNQAAISASGDFVVVLDSDDVYLPERIEAIAEFAAARPDLDILSTDAYFERDARVVGRMYEHRAFPVAGQRRSILDWCFLFAPAVRRKRLIEIGGWDEHLRIAYDWDCWLRLILTGSSAGIVDAPLIRYRLVGGSLSDARARSLRERVTVLDKTVQRDDLTADERTYVVARRVDALRRALVAEAHEAVELGYPDARRKALSLATSWHVPVGLRVRALAATVAPELARRYLGRSGSGIKERFPPA